HSYFCRHFRRTFERKFCNYLNMYKIVEAKKLLEHTDMSISDISASCGFAGSAYFAKNTQECRQFNRDKISKK
ncbi:MAG: helix-turn-helix domain-containing protein, partial [Clostridia bacterium]|nr:helix-turn-helix domain-containing protein [Clostridia bacterium]